MANLVVSQKDAAIIEVLIDMESNGELVFLVEAERTRVKLTEFGVEQAKLRGGDLLADDWSASVTLEDIRGSRRGRRG